MDQIEKENIVINKLIEIYCEENFQTDLKNTAISIVNKIKSVIDDNGNDFDLFSKNSVRDIKYFNIVYRIKEEKSLREKFYRGNLLSKNFTFLKNISNIENEKTRIKQTFKGLGDIIGVKILTDLNVDCKKIHSLLRTHESKLDIDDIKLNKDDLSSQPTVMTNGLDIYKINAHLNQYAFELQIKSKLLSVWGDMEHSIFYKDYFISPVRENTQATMNHIGKLLFQIDDFLESVRESNKLFHEKSDVISFLTWFDKNYSEKIRNKLADVGYKIDSFSELLYFIKNSNKISDTISKRELQFNHFDFNSKTLIYQKYKELRDNNFELKIFESIVFSWLWKSSEIKLNNIDNLFETFFDNIFNYLTEGIIKEYKGETHKKVKNKVIFYIESLIVLKPNADVFFSVKKYLKHLSLIGFIKSELELEGVENIDKLIKNIDLSFLILRMEGEITQQILKDNLSNLQKMTIKENLKLISDNIKKKEKIEFLKEIRYIENLVKHLS